MANNGIVPASPPNTKHHQQARSTRSKRNQSSKNVLHPDTHRRLAWAVDASKRKVVPFAARFIRGDDGQPPPLAKLLRGGRGGEVRLKLYLSMNLLATHEPYDVRSLPARVWAEMLGLRNPHSNGARRVNEAITRLEQERLIQIPERRQGKPVKAQLLSQRGDGGPYSRPTKGYANLPVTFWRKSWIVRLSGRAIALLLILLDLQGGKTRAKGAWVRPSDARRTYGLSEDTWARAVRELQAAGIVRVTRETQGEPWEWIRMRNKYLVRLARLQTPPG